MWITRRNKEHAFVSANYPHKYKFPLFSKDRRTYSNFIII